MLAAAMNRVLVLKWDTNKALGVEFEDLFTDLRPRFGHLEPLVFYNRNLNGTSYGLRERIVSSCTFPIDQRNDFENIAFLLNSKLFARMSDECDVINIISNQFFGPATLLDSYAGSHNQKFRNSFQYPYRKFVSLVITPKRSIISQVQKIIKTFKGRRWLSIHARGKHLLTSVKSLIVFAFLLCSRGSLILLISTT